MQDSYFILKVRHNMYPIFQCTLGKQPAHQTCALQFGTLSILVPCLVHVLMIHY